MADLLGAGSLLGTFLSQDQGQGASGMAASRLLTNISGVLTDSGDLLGRGGGYNAGTWVHPHLNLQGASQSAVGSTTVLVFTPIYIREKCTLSQAAAHVQTATSGSTFAIALYANNASTNKPIGSALAYTSGLSTASTTTVSGPLSSSVQLAPGLYWVAFAVNNTTTTFVGLSTADCTMAAVVGSTTLSDILGSVSVYPIVGYSVSGMTYGTWPTLTTSTSFTSIINSVLPRCALYINSVP